MLISSLFHTLQYNPLLQQRRQKHLPYNMQKLNTNYSVPEFCLHLSPLILCGGNSKQLLELFLQWSLLYYIQSSLKGLEC